MNAWAMIPARGGSKSIPYKNLVELGGRALIDYGIVAAQASGRFDRIICSTEDEKIAAHVRRRGVEVDRRPDHLARDDSAVADVAREMLERLAAGQALPEVLVLVQPTSPFLRVGDIHALLDAMAADPACASGQTVTAVPHNHHAWNQRELADDRVQFRFARERATAYNKQKKPALYVFGNLVAARPAALLAGGDFFGQPSVATVIDRPFDLDVDDRFDLVIAEALIAAGAVDLPHLHPEQP